MRLWLGGYTAEMDGRATGVGALLAGAADEASAGGALSVTGDAVALGGSPSWLAQHPSLDVVYAALEGEGTVQALRRTGEASLERLGAPVAAGEIVCHVAVAPDGRSLVASCWGDGTVTRMSLDAAGRPSAPVTAAPAVDPYAGAAERPTRAHAAAFLPDGRIATTDLGYDLVRIWRAASSGLLLDHEVALPLGCGPRHMVVHPSGHLYVLTELSGEVFVLGPTAEGRWAVRGGIAAALPGDAAAELAASRDGEFLYAAMRGSDTIAVLKVRGAGELLEQTALVESGVRWPRHHRVLRDTLLVAGQLSDEVASLTIDARTGVPGRVRHRTQAATPSCLLPAR